MLQFLAKRIAVESSRHFVSVPGGAALPGVDPDQPTDADVEPPALRDRVDERPSAEDHCSAVGKVNQGLTENSQGYTSM